MTLEELRDELRRGRVWECSLHSRKWQIDGLQDGADIYIDPRPAILETLLHELLHRRNPRLGERAVTRIARNLVVRMDAPTKASWWRAYQRTKRRSRPVDVDD
jgi:hypothetical protein